MNVRGRNSLVLREKDRAREKAGTGENPDQEIALSPDDGNVLSYRGGAGADRPRPRPWLLELPER